jgi:GNAT superfamily N-acetyltransferase
MSVSKDVEASQRFIIRRLMSEDVDQAVVDQLNILLRQVSSTAEPLTLEFVRHLVEVTPTYVAEVGDRIVGHVNRVDTVHLAGMTSWIEDLVVDEEFRNGGIATALMQQAMKGLPIKSKHLNLTSKVTRGGAHRLYAFLGFDKRDGSDGKPATTVWRWVPSQD